MIKINRLSFYPLILILTLCIAAPAIANDVTTAPLPKPTGEVVLTVHGTITHTNAGDVALLDHAMLKALPATHVSTHTSVTDGVHHFEGFLMRDLLERLGAQGATVVATALNNYVIEFATDEFYKYDVLVAYKMDGKHLQPSDKGPLWIVYPRDNHSELQDIRYDYRWVWQLIRLDIK